MKLPYFEINAFVSSQCLGNPAGVCPLQSWLPDQVMQQIAAQNNLSETAFFVPEGDAYGLRWFTANSEVDLCGHATMATAHVLWRHLAYGQDKIIFNTRSGALQVSRAEELIVLNFPVRPGQSMQWQPEFQTVFSREKVVAVEMSRDIMFVLKSEDDVRRYQPDFDLLSGLPGFGCIITAAGSECDFVSRYFLPHDNLLEDPVTGSTHCHLIAYWSAQLGKAELKAKQLSARGGELFCKMVDARVEIAGQANTYLVGEINI